MKLIKLIRQDGATYEFPTSEISHLFSNSGIYRVFLKHNDAWFAITKKQYQALRIELADSIGVTNIHEPIMSITPDGMAKMEYVARYKEEQHGND